MLAETVVVVENDRSTRANAVALIEGAGFSVVALETADQAVSYIWRQPTSVIALFSDVATPGHTSGADLARMVACHWPTITLLMTSSDAPEAMRLPRSTRFLPKPWRPLDVLGALMATKSAA